MVCLCLPAPLPSANAHLRRVEVGAVRVLLRDVDAAAARHLGADGPAVGAVRLLEVLHQLAVGQGDLREWKTVRIEDSVGWCNFGHLQQKISCLVGLPINQSTLHFATGKATHLIKLLRGLAIRLHHGRGVIGRSGQRANARRHGQCARQRLFNGHVVRLAGRLRHGGDSRAVEVRGRCPAHCLKLVREQLRACSDWFDGFVDSLQFAAYGAAQSPGEALVYRLGVQWRLVDIVLQAGALCRGGSIRDGKPLITAWVQDITGPDSNEWCCNTRRGKPARDDAVTM